MITSESQKAYNDFQLLVRTTRERDALFEEIDAVISKLYDTDSSNLDAVIASQSRAEVARTIMRIFVALNVGKNSKAVEGALEDIKKYLHQREILRMDIAFEPNEETIRLVAGWVSRNISGHVLLEFIINRALMGGVTISYQGRYKEIALAALINQFLERENEDIKKMLQVS